MPSRRDFLGNVAGATAGMLLGGRRAVDAAHGAQAAAPRRRVSIGGRRITVVDIHAHTFVPEVWELVKDTPLAATAKNNLTGAIALGPGTPARLQYMDKEGIDYPGDQRQRLGLLGRPRARSRSHRRAERKESQRRWPGIPIDSWEWPRWRCSIPTWRPTSWIRRSESWDCAAPPSAAASKARSSRIASSIRSGRRRRSSASCCSCTLSRPHGTTQNPRLQGKGGLGNTIGNPLETTVFLSHLIFEGTLDRFPGLKICGAHAGGYLPSYSGRSDALCGRGGGGDCKALKRKPSEYFRQQLYIDTMVFREEGLRHLVAEVGVDHMFYGTDYPFDWPVGIDFVLNATFLSDAQKEAILGGNLIKLLRINAKP